MKRFTSIVMSLAVLLAILSGCSSKSSVYEDMTDLLEQMRGVDEGAFTIGVKSSAPFTSDDTGVLPEDMDNLSVSGEISYEKQLATTSVTYDNSQGSTTALTDMVIIGDDSYVNLRQILEVISPSYDEDGGYSEGELDELYAAYIDKVLAGNDYLYTAGDELWLTAAQDDGNTGWSSRLTSDYYNLVRELDAVTYSGGVYKIVMEGEDLRSIITTIASDLSENADAYATLFSAAGDTSSILGSDSLQKQIKAFAQSLSELVQNADAADLKLTHTISYDKSSKTYKVAIDTSLDSRSFEVNYTLTSTEIQQVAEPSSYITQVELEDNIIDSLHSSDFDGLLAGRGDELAPEYDTVESDKLQTFKGRDLSGYSGLSQFDYAGDSGAFYSVPIISSSTYSVDNGVLSSETPGMIQYYFEYPTYGDTASEFMSWYVEDDFYTNPNSPYISDITVSADGNTAVGAFTYYDSYYGTITMLYAATINDSGEYFLFMDLDVYHELMEDADYSLLSELGDLLGVNLSEICLNGANSSSSSSASLL